MWDTGQIEGLRTRQSRLLDFDPELEREYDRRSAPFKRGAAVIAQFTVILVGTSGLLVDWQADILRQGLWMKFGMLTPVCLLLFAYTTLARPNGPALVAVMTMPFILGGMVAIACGMIAEAPFADRYILVAAFVGFAANLFLPLKTRETVLLSIVMIVILNAVPPLFLPWGHYVTLPSMLAFFSAAIVATIFLVRHRERAARRSFLLSLHGERQADDLRALVDELTTLVHHDALTGVGNRRSFDLRYDAVWRIAASRRVPISLVLIDIDHFKKLNDAAGHAAGDVCLKSVAAAIATGAGCPLGQVARYGGEEFVVITETNGEIEAERIRATIEGLALDNTGLGTRRRLTVSVGVASAVPGSWPGSPADLFDMADRALYAAKNAGRNVAFAKSPGDDVARPVTSAARQSAIAA